MRLSEKDGIILSTYQLQADASVVEVAKQVGFQSHTVRYTLQRALRSEVLRKRSFVNLNLLGVSIYGVFFSLSTQRRERREALKQALIQSGKVSVLSRLGGDYQYGMNVCASTLTEFAQFLDGLGREFGAIFLEKSVAARVAVTYFGQRYLAEGRPGHPQRELAYRDIGIRIEIDELDHQILVALTGTPPESKRKLAHELGIPLSTLEYRIKKCESAGLLVGHYFHIESVKLGYQSYLLLVSLKGINAEISRQLEQFCREHTQVVLFIQSIGNWDFEIVVDVNAADDVGSISEALYDQFGSALHWVKVLPVFGYEKVADYPFQDLPRVSSSL